MAPLHNMSYTRGLESKSIFLWVPSQNGLLLEWPQRHNEKAGLVSNLLPSASNNSTSPLTKMEPSSLI